MLFLIIDLFSVLPLLKLIVALQVDSTMSRVTQIKIGPAVTQYEIQPAQGVKVSKIVNLHNDIALALAAKDVRIEAPIPWPNLDLSDSSINSKVFQCCFK